MTCVLGEGMVIDPAVLLDEIQTFRQLGFLAQDENLVVAERAHLTMPYHRELDRLREEGPGKIGTTTRGDRPDLRKQGGPLRDSGGRSVSPVAAPRVVERSVAQVGPEIEALGGQRPVVADVADAVLALRRSHPALRRRRLSLRLRSD